MKFAVVMQAADPTWKRWGVSRIGRHTQWEKSRKAAIALALDWLGGAQQPHTILVTKSEFPEQIRVSVP